VNASRLLMPLIAAVATLLLAILAVFATKPAAAGWLTGFAFWCGPTLGALVWKMIHRVTGGWWGVALDPVFTPASAMIPVMTVLLLPTLLAMPVLYPWMHGAGDVTPSVAHFYLNVPAFVARSVVAFIGWSVLAVAVPRTLGPRGSVLAAVGLVFYGVLISLIPVDWILSLEHPFISESFGSSVAVTQLIAALAWAAVLAPEESRGVEGDLGGLLLATVLGITYIDFMAVLVIWYGDLPDKVFWFLERGQWPWSLMAAAAFVLVSLVPIAALLLTRVRTSREALRVIGVVELVGLAVYNAYLIVPPFGSLALVAAALAVIAIGALLMSLMLTGLPAIAANRERLLNVN
jgi:hypothetical protein